MNGLLSRPWAQPAPRAVAAALADLAGLEQACSPAQRDLRSEAFPKARRFVQQQSHEPRLVPPYRRPFRNNGLPQGLRDARVDVDVFAGIAFV
jgi:hypothetical protein